MGRGKYAGSVTFAKTAQRRQKEVRALMEKYHQPLVYSMLNWIADLMTFYQILWEAYKFSTNTAI